MLEVIHRYAGVDTFPWLSLSESPLGREGALSVDRITDDDQGDGREAPFATGPLTSSSGR